MLSYYAKLEFYVSIQEWLLVNLSQTIINMIWARSLLRFQCMCRAHLTDCSPSYWGVKVTTAWGLTVLSIAADLPPPLEKPLSLGNELRRFQEIALPCRFHCKVYPKAAQSTKRNSAVKNLQPEFFVVRKSSSDLQPQCVLNWGHANVPCLFHRRR